MYVGNVVRERDSEMRNPISLVRKRKSEVIFSLVSKRKRERMESPNSLFGGRIGELDGITGNVGGEGNEDAENPDSSSVGNVFGERKSVVKSSKSLVSLEMKRDGDTPPDDDCCPICFGNFTIACKTNCGHWFCASCILQFWNYRAVLQKCKCPICSCLISKLTPEASLLIRQEDDVIDVLKNVQRYNRLFQGGVHGLIRKALEFPLVIKRMLRGLMNPDRFRANYYAMRFFALLLSCIYNLSPFDFIPAGPLGARRLFDICAVALVVIFCLVGICHRLILRRRVRRLAAAQP